MLRLTRSQLQPIGIDIGHDSVKMLQLEVNGGAVSVHAAAKLALPPESRTQPQARIALAVDIIRTALRRGGFRGRSAVLALPREMVQIKNFRLPLMSASELASAVLLEAQQLFTFDVESSHIQYLPAGEVRQGNDVLQEVIVLGAAGDDVNNFVEQMHRCGLLVQSLDAEPCALFRSVERFIRRREDEQEVHVLVDVGLSGSQVVIGRGREITFLKAIDIGGQHLHEAVAKRLGISYDEAVALRGRLIQTSETDSPEKRDPVRQAVFDSMRSVMEQLGSEIALCLRYQSVTFRGYRPTRLRLLGGEAGDPHLQAILRTMVTIPVEPGRPLCSVDASRMAPADRQGATGQWAAALGLGLKRTIGRFGLRDGRPRGVPLPPEPDTAQPGTDLTGVVADGAEQASVAGKAEAAHA